jgi:hypothetical protein
MRKGKVVRISEAVLKWLIPAQKVRYGEARTGRNLDLPPHAGYRAIEMFSSTRWTHSAHDFVLLTEFVRSVSEKCDAPTTMSAAMHNSVKETP